MYNQLLKIARSLWSITDSQTNNILILADPNEYYYPCYITIKKENNYLLLKTISLKKYLQFNQFNVDYRNYCYKIMQQDLYYNNEWIEKYCQKIKIVNIDELKQQLIYGQYRLDITTFKQLYSSQFINFKYKDFCIYIIDQKFKEDDIKKFLDTIYKIVPNSILKKVSCNIQFRQKIENNRIAQQSKSIQITCYNVHAFIHQIGHKLFEQFNHIQNNIITLLYNNQKQFSSILSKQNRSEYFSQLFAFYFQNKLNIKQKEFIETYILNLNHKNKVVSCNLSTKQKLDDIEQLNYIHYLTLIKNIV